MFDLKTKIKRQIELVGLALDNEEAKTAADMADIYACEELTIKRDLQELRGYGVDIHSEARRGIQLSTPLDASKIRQMVIQYLGLCTADNTVDRASTLMVRKLKGRALSHIVTLQRCVDQAVLARIEYEKEDGQLERDVEIAPILMFQSEGMWRVLAQHDGRIKQYILNKITSVRGTARKFKPIPQAQVDEMFRHSFRSWIGTEKHKVRLRLSPTWASRLKPRQAILTDAVEDLPDGGMVLEATVNSLDEIATWVVGRGEGVEVLEPEELKRKVIELAHGALRNY